MAKREEREPAVDIFGEEIRPGTIVMMVSSGAKLDVAVVRKIKHRTDGRLMGYQVDYPMMYTTREIKQMTKHVRPGRELVVIPPEKMTSLISDQACWVDNFANRILYLSKTLSSSSN